ncbi:hypothetical protein CERSUDRAFT_28615, partial [Gelatoporia subvermispora B]
PHGQKTTVGQRQAALENDRWTKVVEPRRVRCGGCDKWISLRENREYELANWQKHKTTCAAITGVVKKRILVKVKPAKTRDHESQVAVKVEVPDNGNKAVKERFWTKSEKQRLDYALKAWARWEVDYNESHVRSTRCTGTTVNASRICDACQALSTDRSLKAVVRKAKQESELPQDEQQAMHAAREKYVPRTFRNVEARALQSKLQDPIVWNIWKTLEKHDSTKCFLQLYQYAVEGHLKKHQTFTDICSVLADRLRRENAAEPNSKLKYGMRYPRNYLNFMTLLRSHGQNSAQQYGILTGQLGGPSPRLLRRIVSRSPDCLQNPMLDFENLARVKRWLDSRHFSDVPVAIAGDCTKVHKRLTYSNDFGSHVLGSVFTLSECSVDDPKDIDEIISRVKKEDAYATQTRAILVKVPIPQIPPFVIALLPVNGSDTAEKIHSLHMRILQMAAQLQMRVVSFSADGAASEISAQSMMDHETTELPHLEYEYKAYGIHVRAPVFKVTGPLVSISDPQHARKTSRNQPQHGTHTASLGRGYLVNTSLIQLYETGNAGLVHHDVENVDKQDDDAARRVFHHIALAATTVPIDGTDNRSYYPEQPFCPWLMGTEFVEHFFGLARTLLPNFTYAELLKLVKHVMLRQRILLSGNFSIKKERDSKSGYSLDFDTSPLSPEDLRHARVTITRTQINKLVVLAYKEASAIAKQLLRISVPTSALILQPLGRRQIKKQALPEREKDEGVGNSSDEEIDEDPDTADSTSNLEGAICEAAHYTARYAALSEDYEETLLQFQTLAVCDSDLPPQVPGETTLLDTVDQYQSSAYEADPTSDILDAKDRVSISAMLDVRRCHQSGTSTKSERTVM